MPHMLDDDGALQEGILKHLDSLMLTACVSMLSPSILLWVASTPLPLTVAIAIAIAIA